jgi:hypothetical protein
MFGLTPSRLWESGLLGLAVYWLGWFLDLISLGIIVYFAYLATLVGGNYWMLVVGSSPLVCAILVIFFTFLHLVLHFLYQFGFFLRAQDYLKFGCAGAFFTAFLLLSINLRFYGPSEVVRNRRPTARRGILSADGGPAWQLLSPGTDLGAVDCAENTGSFACNSVVGLFCAAFVRNEFDRNEASAATGRSTSSGGGTTRGKEYG